MFESFLSFLHKRHFWAFTFCQDSLQRKQKLREAKIYAQNHTVEVLNCVVAKFVILSQYLQDNE